MEVKQVIVVRKDLNMRKGKIAAQVAHASFSVLLNNTVLTDDFFSKNGYILTFDFEKESPWDIWLNGDFTKVVVSCNSEEELEKLYNEAKDSSIPCSLIVDAGKTEFNGVATKTCAAIGPFYSKEIDKITGNLKLL